MFRPLLRASALEIWLGRQSPAAPGVPLSTEVDQRAPNRPPGVACANAALPQYRYRARIGETVKQCENAMNRGISYFLRLRSQSGPDRCRQPVPVGGFLPEALAAGSSQFVKLGPSIIFGGSPIGFQQALADQPEKPWIQRALLDQ